MGSLTLLSFTGRKSHSYWVWECVCDCGTTVEQATYQLRKEHPSCGCKTVKGRKRTYECPVTNSLYHGYKRAAKDRDFTFTLSRAEFSKLIREPCRYCGEPPFQRYRNSSCERNVITRGGVDRIDSARGYEVGNVVPCCKFCNVAKGSMTLDEFSTWAAKVYLQMHVLGLPP